MNNFFKIVIKSMKKIKLMGKSKRDMSGTVYEVT